MSQPSRAVPVGKYLTFALGEESYGIEILRVSEIMRVRETTRLPNAPKYLRGVIHLRGRILPVVDMRLKFGLEPKGDTDRTCIIVVDMGAMDGDLTAGLVVDEVSDVIDLHHDQVEVPHWLGTKEKPGFISGMGKVEDHVLILLDIEEVLSREEVLLVRQEIGDANQGQSPILQS